MIFHNQIMKLLYTEHLFLYVNVLQNKDNSQNDGKDDDNDDSKGNGKDEDRPEANDDDDMDVDDEKNDYDDLKLRLHPVIHS